MRRWIPFALALTSLLVMSGAAPGAGGKGKAPLDMYEATVDAAQVAKLARSGYDVAAAHQVPNGMRVDLVLTPRDRDRLASEGVKLELIRNAKGQTVRQQASRSGSRWVQRVALLRPAGRDSRRAVLDRDRRIRTSSSLR